VRADSTHPRFQAAQAAAIP
jgi:hypothetical protein